MRKGATLEELVFWHIYDRPHCQRGELGEHFGVSPATVSRAVSLLLDRELIVQAVGDAAAAGRKPQLLQVNPGLATLLGIEIELDRVTAVATDMAGGLLGRGSIHCDARQGPEPVIDACQQAVRRALADAGLPRRAIRNLGVGHPGDLDLAEGVCVCWANAAAWNGVRVRAKLEEVFRMEITLDDHSRAQALAERHTSPGDWGHHNALYVQAGAGVGTGIFLEGRLFRGTSRGGGELGHTVIDPDGPLCKCGNRGCVEALAGEGAILAGVREALASGAGSVLRPSSPETLTLDDVIAAAHQGDKVAQTVMHRAATALGIGIANAVQILNPSLVVLCGRLSRLAGNDLLEAVSAVIRRQCVATASRLVRVRVASPKKDISAVGCALLAAEAEAQRVVRQRLLGE